MTLHRDDTPADHSAPALLERRPEARSFRIEDLLLEVRQGRVRIPSFQRGIKWKREDASKLLDSIYRGYPVGTLLLWQTKAEAGEVKFGTVTILAGGRSDALWVVDGQQRVMSLARVLLASEPDADDFALYFDLDDARFVAAPKARPDGDPSRWLPMTEVLDSEQLIRWLLEASGIGKDRRDRAIQLGRRIREYDIPAYVVYTDSEMILREVFQRSNSHGRRLEAHDVFDALHGARTSGSPASIADIVRELESLDFGVLQAKIVHRLLRVLQGVDITPDTGGEPLRLSEAAIAPAYGQTAAVARSVVQFVKVDAGIPHYDLLPYKQPLVTLGKFFQHHPSPSPRSRDLLVRWLWRGALNGAHQGNTVSTRQALDLIEKSSEERSVQGLLGMVGRRSEHWPDPGQPFNFRHAASKLQALALMTLKPRDLASGELLRLEMRDMPFQQVIGTSVAGERALWRGAANRLAHPARPGLRRLLLSVRDEGVLASHGISHAAIGALHAGDAAGFLIERAGYLERYFFDFFERHARWEEPDRPSIASLVVEDVEL